MSYWTFIAKKMTDQLLQFSIKNYFQKTFEIFKACCLNKVMDFILAPQLEISRERDNQIEGDTQIEEDKVKKERKKKRQIGRVRMIYV